MIIKNSLTLNLEDKQLTFIRPSSTYWENKAIVVYEDAYGGLSVNIQDENVMKNYLTPEQIIEVMTFIKPPVLIK